MLKRTIKFTDFDGNEQEEVHYFNLTKAELKEMQFGQAGGFGAHIERAIESGDIPTLFMEFKTLILKAYGQRSEDGKRFVKSPQIAEEFTQTAAYDQLFNEITEEQGALIEFMKGIMPAEILDQVDITELFEEGGTALERAQAAITDG